MPRRNPSLVGAKLSHQSARTPRSQTSKPTPRQARRPAPEPSNRRARRNKFVTFYRGGHLRSGFQLRIRHPTRKIFTCAETDTIEPARIEESSLSNVRSEHAGGLFVPLVGPGNCVVRGQVPARRALAQQRRSASVGATRATAGAHPAESGSSRTARCIPVDCFLENAAPDEDGSDGHHPQHGHDDADRARGAKGRRRKQQHCNRAADGTT